jgi:hypothetical protein
MSFIFELSDLASWCRLAVGTITACEVLHVQPISQKVFLVVAAASLLASP